MAETIRGMCVLAVFCGLALELAPKGGAKRVLSLLCTAVLMLALLSNLKQLDFSLYAREQTRLRERQISQQADELHERLDRLVIQQELETYILDKAGQAGIGLTGAEFQLSWNREGFWVPAAVTLHGKAAEPEKESISRILSEELGIPEEAQTWSEDE